VKKTPHGPYEAITALNRGGRGYGGGGFRLGYYRRLYCSYWLDVGRDCTGIRYERLPGSGNVYHYDVFAVRDGLGCDRSAWQRGRWRWKELPGLGLLTRRFDGSGCRGNWFTGCVGSVLFVDHVQHPIDRQAD
jgi:hypothetical protein